MGSVLLPGTTAWAGSVTTGDLASSRGVWVASVWDDTGVGKVIPSLREITTLTGIVGFVTRDHILWGEDNVVTTLDTGSVGKNLRGRESPAGATPLLIPDVVHASAPLIPGVEGVGKGDVILDDFGLLVLGFLNGGEDGTKKELLDLSLGETGEFVGGGDPIVLDGVDMVDFFLETDESSGGDGDERDGD